MTSRTRIQDALDFSFSFLVSGPLTILFWRGTFNSLTRLAFQDSESVADNWYPALLLWLTGVTVKILLDLVKQSLGPTIRQSGAILGSLANCLMVYLDSVFSVVLWVGGFNILYVFPGLYWWTLTPVLIFSSSALLSLRAFHCTVGAPLLLHTNDNILVANNYFGTKMEINGVMRVIGDTFFSYLVVHSLVVMVWWSMWELENRYILYPCEITVKDIMAWDSVVLSIMFALVVITINRSVVNMKKDDGPWRRSITINFVAFISFLATLNFWRGIWSLQDFYFLPSINWEENLAISHVVGFVCLHLAQTSINLTQSSCSDLDRPNFHHCNYWGVGGCMGEEEDSERRPLLSSTENLV